MQFTPHTVVKLALIAALTATVAACASKPAYSPAPSQDAPQNVSPPNQPPRPAPTGPVSGSVLPGSVQDFVVNVGDRVYFDFDSYTIRGDASPVLDAQADWLRRFPNVVVRLEGNADERGTREYNFALGARRANAVRDHLVSRGVASSRIETVSYGKERPLNPGSDENAYAQNRNTKTTITGGAR